MRIAVIVVALAGCVVMRPPENKERPRWQVNTSEYAVGCLRLRAFVRKTGFDGIGLALQLKSVGDCRVELTGGVLIIGRGTVAIAGTPMQELRGRSLIYTWLPVRFDNNAAWNDDDTSAMLELVYAIDGVVTKFTLSLREEAP